MKTIQSNILNSINLIPLGLVFLSLLSGAILVSSTVSAEDPSVVDEINITVPVSCTMTGTGMNTHNAEIANGTYTPNIGSTTLHAFCNDNEGFAIYAAGYTGNEIGGESSNKLVGTTASGNSVIESGIATSAGNPDISNWAMKLTMTQDSGDTTADNTFTIDSAPNVSLPSQAEQGATSAPFSDYHTVPNEYVKVAHKNSGTDMTETTGGVKLTTTYAAYISKTQPADTYTGQVIYTLVHPSTTDAPVHPDQIGVRYHADSTYQFANGETKNLVAYKETCGPDGTYTATTPEVIETSNLTDGVQNGSYTSEEYVRETKTFDGASKVKVEINYGISSGTIIAVVPDTFQNVTPEDIEYISMGGSNLSGTFIKTYDGNTVSVVFSAQTAPTSDEGYDYGMYAKFYPIYDTEQPNTVENSSCSYIADNGTYTDTTPISTWYTLDNNNKKIYFDDESAVLAYLAQNNNNLLSTTVDVYATTAARLDTGTNVSVKLKSLAVGTTKSTYDTDTLIKAIRMSEILPENFTPADENTISLATSRYPVYIWFDNTNDAGIIYVYTEAKEILMNPYSDHMFGIFTALTDLSGLTNWDTSSVISMDYMFYGATSLTDLSPLANWDTSSVISMGYMFSHATSLTDLSPLAGWDTSSVMYMTYMFDGATSLTDLSGLASWDTGSVTYMSSMFYGATSLTDLSPLASWDTSSVGDMGSMFQGATSLTDLSPLASWDTGSVASMYSMFSGATSLTQAGVDAINAWDITNVGESNFKYMFKNVPYHPTFTKRQGTWDSSGTFTPSS